MKNSRNYIFAFLLLYLAASIIYLAQMALQLMPGDPVRSMACFLIVQDAAAAAVLIAACLLRERKKRANAFASPFRSLLLFSKEGELQEEVTLLNTRSLFLAKDKGGIAFETAPTASADALHYAALNLVLGQWYIEAVSGSHPVGLRKENEGVVYRLKTAMPYKLSSHDMIYIDSEKIAIQ